MSNDERAVPKTRARAELTATACKLPSPSLMMKKHYDDFDRGGQYNLTFQKG